MRYNVAALILRNLSVVLGLAGLLWGPAARAEVCGGEQGLECNATSQCLDNALAKLCVEEDFYDGVSGKCEVPCEDSKGKMDRSMCSLGETCVLGQTDKGSHFYCKTTPFVMDLNLLDMCLTTFIDGTHLDLSSDDQCSLSRRLTSVLDQDGDYEFTIYDVEKCIATFLDIEDHKCECPLDTDNWAGNQLLFGDSCLNNKDCEDEADTHGVVDDGDVVEICDRSRNACRRQCDYDIDCADLGAVCGDDGMCRLFCTSDAQCKSGSTDLGLSCDKPTGLCRCKAPTCDDSDGRSRVFCANDADCGTGLFCNAEQHYCERECGYIVDRQVNDGQLLERKCSGSLKTCDYSHGRCMDVDLENLTCTIDGDCPSGAYCFVGQCEPKCYAAIQCPDSSWYCSQANQCLPLPRTGGPNVEPFDPKDYSLLFSQRTISLSTINNEYRLPLLIMNVKTRKQVMNSPNVVFGYRLETNYAMKQDAKCTGDLSALFEDQIKICGSDETCKNGWKKARLDIIDDCYIDPDEEFVTLLNPFGTVYGDGDPTIDVRLNPAAVDDLTPGTYQVTLMAIFNNGDRDTATITFVKPSPNGDYTGLVHIYRGGLETALGYGNVKMQLYIHSDQEMVVWDKLLQDNNLDVEKDFIDLNRGYPVYGYIDGNASLVFNNPTAFDKASNLIPLKGIYSPDRGYLRVTTAIELEPGHCRSEDGPCNYNDPEQLQSANPFGRKIRRVVEFLGPFDVRTLRYSGGYRETISGLVPGNRDLTLEGEFELRQTKQDDTVIEINEPLLKPGKDFLGNEMPVSALGFVPRYQLLAALNQEIGEYCDGFGAASGKFDSFGDFQDYLAGLDMEVGMDGDFGGAIFQRMTSFEGEVGRALTELSSNQGSYLTLSEYLKGAIPFCDSGVQDETCINADLVRCGLALYRKALLSVHSTNEHEACAVDSHCDDGYTCDEEAGYCKPTCTPGNGSETCDLGMMCPEPSHDEPVFCIPHCVADKDCGGLTCNLEHQRCECLRDSDCGEGLICDPTLGLCSEASAGWVDLGAIEANSDYDSYTLFCPAAPLDGSDCLVPASQNPALRVLQEHNRFYKELVQTLSYEAAGELSDAFYTLYKAYQGDELDADSAFAYKKSKLYSAIATYNELQRQAFSPAATAVMFQWPMGSFATKGRSWLQYLQTATSDRLEAISELMGLRRRVLQDTDDRDYMYIQHLMQDEFLTQVLLFSLQEDWQGSAFAYEDGSQKILDRGVEMLAKVNLARNPLGFHPDKVYFENNDVRLSNWQYYRGRLETKLTKAEQTVAQAIENLKGALRDQDTLESTLQQAAHIYDERLEGYCGENAPLPAECMISVEERELEQSCSGPECTFEWNCSGYGAQDDCDQAVSIFNNGLGSITTTACRTDGRILSVFTNNEERNCVRGQMGSLLQEGIVTTLQRSQVTNKVEALLRQISREHEMLSKNSSNTQTFIDWNYAESTALAGIKEAVLIAESLMATAQSGVDLLMCEAPTILAATNPGNCIQAVAAKGIFDPARGKLDGAMQHFENALAAYQALREKKQAEMQLDKEKRAARANLDSLLGQVENYVYEYQILFQQQMNNEIRITDTLFQAKQAAGRYNEQVNMVIDHLIGRESGSVLLRNKLIKRSNAEFEAVLDETYKMARAFVHRYNLSDDATSLVNQVYQLQTTEDVRVFLEALNEREALYCGAQGLDCDYKSNQKVLRISLRESLGDFRDEVINGRLVTAGEKFHNLITSSLYTMKRKRASGVRLQLQLPVLIPLTPTGSTGTSKDYLVNPEECNHFITAERNGGATASGTIAVNVIGSRLHNDIQYELWRGDVDYVRSCHERMTPIQQSIDLYRIGWAAQHAQSALDNPETYLNHSQAFTACKNNWRLDDPNTRNSEDSCYNFFGRDRSLGTMDMQLVLPFLDGEQAWLLGEGLKQESQPVIEDIVLYIRYNSQPISSDGN